MKYSIMYHLSIQEAAEFKFRREYILMIDDEQRLLKEFVTAREEVALRKLKNNAQYCEISHRQEKTGAAVEELLHRFEKEDRISIRRHYEGETEKPH